MCFLLKQVDPNFEFGANFEDEVKFYFKSFGYPYSISKSSLQAVGTPHTWPALLAALVWFIEFLTYDEEVKSNPEVTGLDTVNGDKFFFDYAAEAYNIFLHGGDTYDSLDQHLADTFDAKNQSVNEEISYFKQTNQNLKTQISTMKNGQSELVSLETKKTTAEADLQKFKHLNTQLTEHVEQLQKKFDSIKSEHQQKQIELKELAEEKTKLEDQLDKQELSHFEVQSMTHRRCMLEESLASLDEQKQKIQADIWDIEMKMCKSIAQVESNIHEFNALGVKLHMIPSSAKFAGGEDYELTFNPHKETLHEMLNIDLKVVVKPTLLALKRRLGDRVVEKQLKSRDLCEHLKQSNEFKIDEKRRVDELEQRLAKAEDSFVQEREITMSEMRGSYEKLEEQEMDIKRMEAGQTHMLKESERSLQKMDQKLEDIKDLYDQEIESFNNEICEAMDMLTAHKVHVSTLLEQLESQTVQVLEDVQAE